MKGSRKSLRPQDVLVALKLKALEGLPWTQMELARSLGLSQTEIAFSLERLRFHHLIGIEKKKVLPGALLEFLVHGLKYVFPAEVGALTRGTPTAGSAKPLSQKFRLSESQRLVWPDADGTVRGQSLEPIYETVPMAARGDSLLHELLALSDALRMGSVRERDLAAKLISERILGSST